MIESFKRQTHSYGGVVGAENRLFDELMDMQDEPIPEQIKVMRKKEYASIAVVKDFT